MATYKGINGFAVQSVASDPSPLDEGQVWYNNATYAFKLAGFNAAAWSSGGTLNQGGSTLGAAGTQTAALAFGGFIPSPGTLANTEKYNGTSWTTNPTGLNTARYSMAGFGTQTAAIAAGGDNSNPTAGINNVESFNGSSWTAVNTINTARRELKGVGTNTAGLVFGGEVVPAGTAPVATESWNGTSWTTSPGTLNTGRFAHGASGIQTAALAFGGYAVGPAVNTAATESWSGTAWTSVSSMNTARQGLIGFGTQTSAVAAAGNLPPGSQTDATELWNGSSWTTSPATLPTVNAYGAPAGNQTAGLLVGGGAPPRGLTQEWNGAAVATKTITTS